MRSKGLIIGVAAAALTVGIVGCSSDGDSGTGGSAAQTTAEVQLPASITPTAPGTTLKLNETAYVPIDSHDDAAGMIGVTVTNYLEGNVDDVNEASSKEQARGEVFYVQYTITNASDAPLPDDFELLNLGLVMPDKKPITPRISVPGLKNCDGVEAPPKQINKGQSYTSCTVVRGGSEVFAAGYEARGETDATNYRGNPILWKK